MATLLLPLEVTLLANVTLIRQLHWIDSLQALILPFAATAFGTFLIRQAFLGIPHEIQDATRIDGYGHLDFLWRFAVPLTRPVIASFTVISALGAWNQYLWPRAVIENPDVDTLQIALRNLTSTELASANIGVAGALLAAAARRDPAHHLPTSDHPRPHRRRSEGLTMAVEPARADPGAARAALPWRLEPTPPRRCSRAPPTPRPPAGRHAPRRRVQQRLR